MKILDAFNRTLSRACNEEKLSIKRNLNELVSTGGLKIDKNTLEKIIHIVNASIDEGLAKTPIPTFEADEPSVVVANIPDELLDAMLTLSSKKKKGKFCVFTIVRNEPFFLPIWCDYYSKQFGEKNLYILNNSTSDGSVENAKHRWPNINIIDVPSREALLYAWTTEIAKSFQRTCLKAYDVVIFSDVDEFLIPSSKWNSLREFCEAFRVGEKDYVRAKGWSPIHQIDHEKPVKPGFLFEDRNAMWQTPHYDKTLISKIPLNWAKGIHTIYDNGGNKLSNDPIENDLDLVHIRDVDFDHLLQRCIGRYKMHSLKSSSTFGTTNVEELKTYFRTLKQPWVTNQEEQEFIGVQMPIPNHWRSLLKT